MSALIVHCDDPAERESGLRRAGHALASGQCIVMPTDTVYGIACDAFSPDAVNLLLATKGRGRHMPPPVLVGGLDDVPGLVRHIPDDSRLVMESFWPGGVTIVLWANPALEWDLGDTSGTVAIRMPDHPVALELLRMTGPLAVSSANRTGQPAAQDAGEAYAQFGDDVPVYVDAGRVGQEPSPSLEQPGSTIIDATGLDAGGPWRVLRYGVRSIEDIRAVTSGEWEL